MKVTRRDLLVWGTGAAAGLIVTPVPWKLLDDVSIWSQNWRSIPQPTQSPVEVKQSFCTLCPKGCGLRVSMAGGWPVGVAGMPNHPISRGALCPLAFGAHQLNWHPQRLRTVQHRGKTTSWNAARTAFAQACSEGPVVIIDGCPGRAASTIFESFVCRRNGSYRVMPSPETLALRPYENWSGVPAASLGYDLKNAQTIVSFGAPLLDGWGVPGRFTRLWAKRGAGAADPQLRLIQVEAALSRTAARAWKWVPIRDNSEPALAAAIVRVLLEEHLVSARSPVPQLSVAESANQAGLSADSVRDLARAIAARPPVLAIANNDSPAIAAMNVVLGAVGTPGGIVKNSNSAKSHLFAEVPFSGARAVLIDSTVPWDLAPHAGAEVFRFAAWDGGSSNAEWLLPAPGFLEELTDIPTAHGSAVETYAIAPGLVKAPHEVHSAAEFLAAFDPKLPSTEAIIHARCQEIFRRRIGTVHVREAAAIAKFESAQKFEEQLRHGSVWMGEPPRDAGIHCELKEWPALSASSSTQKASWSAPVLPPLASKLFQESNLREAPAGRHA